VPDESSARTSGEPTPNLPIQVFASGRLHGDVAREGVQQRDVFLCGVAQGPQVTPRSDDNEMPGRLELRRCEVGLVLGQWRWPGGAIAFAEFVIHLLDLREERVEVRGEGVPRVPHR
jgi:hypothetical protein